MSEEIKKQDSPVIPCELPSEVITEQEKGTKVLMLTGEDEGKIYFRYPKKPQINRFLSSSMKGKTSTAVENLLQDLVIYPKYKDLKQQNEHKPMRMIAISNALQEELGLTEDFSVKKL